MRYTKKVNGDYLLVVDNCDGDQKLGFYEDLEEELGLTKEEIAQILTMLKNTKINIQLICNTHNFVEYNNKRMNNEVLTQSEYALLKKWGNYGKEVQGWR